MAKIVIFIILVILATILFAYNTSKKAEKDILEKMFKEGDIDSDTYKKYLGED